MAAPLEQWFLDVPIVTRLWTTAVVLTSVAVQINLLSPFQLFFSFQTAFVKKQYWRLITTFLYFGPLSLDFMFHIFFLARYSRMLEESFYQGRTADFAWLLFYSACCLIALSPITAMPFLGSPLSFSLVYIWAQRNPGVRLSFLGLFVFNAPYLPWVLLMFSILLHNHLPKDDLLGIGIGHVYFYFSDVYPRITNGSRPLDPPEFWRRLFNQAPTIQAATSNNPRNENPLIPAVRQQQPGHEQHQHQHQPQPQPQPQAVGGDER